jgi:hydroxyacylglutathione hydrolase
MSLEIVLLPCRSDNYAVLLHDSERGETAVIDTPDGAIIEDELLRRDWKLTHIFTTHHHADHTEGHNRLKKHYGATVIAPASEADKIPGVDVTVSEGSIVRFAGLDVMTIETPGHTNGHVAFYIPSEGVVFVGDTMFALGCGRLLEGTPGAMWRSLTKLADLPPDTVVYCGHEYTLGNANFALTIEPGNVELVVRAAAIEAARAKGEPTVPFTIADELMTNPFVRADQATVKAAVGMPDAPAEQVFAEIRARKDRF